jgi:hypothetical protein
MLKGAFLPSTNFNGATMIDPLSESLVTFTEATKLLPGRPNLATLWRWRTAGVRGIKLESVLVGGKRYTSREALQRFVERTTAVADGQPIPSRTSRQAERSRRAARKQNLEARIALA